MELGLKQMSDNVQFQVPVHKACTGSSFGTVRQACTRATKRQQAERYLKEATMQYTYAASLHRGTATVWFGETLVFGSFADNGTWVHPPHACGRDNTPVPPTAERDRMWQSCVESQSDRKDPEVGSRYPCRLPRSAKL